MLLIKSILLKNYTKKKRWNRVNWNE